jgi:hypothetical protein
MLFGRQGVDARPSGWRAEVTRRWLRSGFRFANAAHPAVPLVSDCPKRFSANPPRFAAHCGVGEDLVVASLRAEKSVDPPAQVFSQTEFGASANTAKMP